MSHRALDKRAWLPLRKSSSGYSFISDCQHILTQRSFPVFDTSVFDDWLMRLSKGLQTQATWRKPIVKARTIREEAVQEQAAKVRATGKKAPKKQVAKGRPHVLTQRSFPAFNAWLTKLSKELRIQAAERKQAADAEKKAAREQAARERENREQAAREQKKQAWETLQKREIESLLARRAIWCAEKSIERAWEKMARWNVTEAEIETTAQEIQAATKEIQAMGEEIKNAEEQQQILAEQVRNADEALKIINPTPPSPYHPRYNNEKMDVVVESLQTMSETIFFRYPVLSVAAILVIVYAGETLAGALIGGVLLGMSFAPPLLALAIVGLVYLKQKIDKPSTAPRHSFFYVNPGEHKADIANTPSSFINEEDHSDGLINIYQKRICKRKKR